MICSVSECVLSDSELSSRLSVLGEGGSMTCSGEDFVWTMTLTCGGNDVWSDSGSDFRTEQCVCDNSDNQWSSLEGLSCASAHGRQMKW